MGDGSVVDCRHCDKTGIWWAVMGELQNPSESFNFILTNSHFATLRPSGPILSDNQQLATVAFEK